MNQQPALNESFLNSVLKKNYIVIFKPTYEVDYLGEGWQYITGTKKITDLREIFPENQFGELYDRIQLCRKGDGEHFQLRLADRNNKDVCLEARLFCYESGPNHLFILHVFDSTEQINLTNRLVFGYENSPDVIYELDIINKRYNYVSPACNSIFEVTREEVLKLRPGSLEHKIHPEDYQRVHNYFQTLCKKPGQNRFVGSIRYRYLTQSGIKWLVDRHTVFYNQVNLPYLLIGNIRDITESQEATEKLRMSEMIFKTIAEHASDIIVFLDRHGRVRYISPSIKDLFSFETDFILGKHPYEFMPEHTHPEIAMQFEKVLNNPGIPTTFNLKVYDAACQAKYLRMKFINYLHQHEIGFIIGMMNDITEQVVAEIRLHESYQNLNDIIENTSDPVWSLDTQLRLISFNSALKNIMMAFFGFEIQPGMPLFDSIIEHGFPDQTECRNHFLSVIKEGKPVKFERVYQVGARDVIMEYSICPLRNSEGKITGATCTGRDTTERVENRKWLEQQNQELVKANRELDRLIYSISHDLRSPVTSALGLINLIEQESNEPETLKQAGMIRKRLNRLDVLLNDILTFMKGRKDKIKIERICLSELIEMIIRGRGIYDTGVNFELQVDIDETIPAYTDQVKLSSILDNLISNAIRYHDPNKAKLRISISGKTDEEHIQLTVRDNGIGIADKHKDKIFEMFYRVSSNNEGSGLGLYIVKEMVEMLNGSLSLESAIMEGSAFTLTLPNRIYEPAAEVNPQKDDHLDN